MSGPERELPPLRVKLIGDGSSYKKMVADAKKDAISLSNALNRMLKKSGMSGSRSSGSSGGGGGGGYGGGMGLGNRADIYMHRDAIRGIAEAWKGPLDRLKDYQTRLASMATFMGGDAQAKSFLGGLQQSQVGQMYGKEAALGAQRFQPHTKDANETMKVLKTVGDLAFGDEQRFHGLSRALSQVMAQKYLQGDENEQFAENEIALHQMIADAYGITTAEVVDLQAERRISSDMVLAVLKKETAQGGKYAGQLGKIASGLKGAEARARSLYAELEREILQTIEEDLANLVKTLAHYLYVAVEWVKNNKDLVTVYAKLLVKLSAAAVAFHVLGLAVALVSWNITQLGKLTIFLTIVKRVLIGTTVLLSGVITVLRVSIAATIVAYRAWIAVIIATRTALTAFAAGVAVVRTVVVAYVATSYAAAVATHLMNVAFLRMGMVGTFLSGTMNVLRLSLSGVVIVLRALRIGTIITWLAFLGPIPIIIGGIALITYSIYQLVSALLGTSISFYQIMDYAKAAALTIAGFFANLGHNAKVIATYVYTNFWTLMSDLVTAFTAGFKMFPVVLRTAFVTGMRIMAAFIGWLSEALPKAMESAAKLMWNGLSWFFTKAYNAGSELWKYLTSGKAAEDVSSFGGVLVGDMLDLENKGIARQLADITAEEFGKMAQETSGIMSGLEFKSPEMTGLKFDLPQNNIMDALGFPTLGPIPDINDPLAQPGILPEIPGAAGGEKSAKALEAVDAMRQNSSESARFQHSLRMKGMETSEAASEAEYKKEMIEQAKKQAVLLEAIKNGIINKPLTNLNVAGLA